MLDKMIGVNCLLHIRRETRRTVHKFFIVLFKVCFSALGSRSNRHRIVFVCGSSWGKLVQVRALVLTNDQEANSVRPTTILLGVNLCLCTSSSQWSQSLDPQNNELSAIAETRRFTGTGRLNIIRSDIACWRIKLLK